MVEEFVRRPGRVGNGYQLLLYLRQIIKVGNLKEDGIKKALGRGTKTESNVLCSSSQIFLTLKLPTYLNYYIYQSETIPRRSMYPIRHHFKPYPIVSSPGFSFEKENLLSVLPTSLPGQTSNPNQNVGDDAGDTSTLDSTLSKCTKCTYDSSSDLMDDYEPQYFLFNEPEKCSKKQLKKEMKNQKIKRKQQEKIKFNLKFSKKDPFQKLTPPAHQFPSHRGISNSENSENSLVWQSLGVKIQKLTQLTIANPAPKKKIHTQNGSAPSKTHLPFLSLLQLDDVQALIKQSQDSKSKQNLFPQQTRIIQQVALQYQKIQTLSVGNYFIDDLIQELKSKTHKKSKKYPQDSKLSFIQNLIDHSERYQLAIQNAKPNDNNIQKIYLQRRPCDNDKKTLLIDLDDTLIFTSSPIDASQLSENDLKIAQNDGKFRKLYLRPHAREFLKRMSRLYEIIIFTAATKCYAEQIRNILDPENTIISHLLDRQFCFNPNNPSGKDNKLPYIKDLRKLNRDLSKTVLLDNSIYCFWYQINNGIPIVSYNKEKQQDNELLKVEKYLIQLIDAEDVRQKNKQYFKLEEYEQHVNARILVEELYLESPCAN